MIKVYLDWNVISQMKQGQFEELHNVLSDKEKFLTFYSTSHISDILRSYKDTPEQKAIINDDLDYIKSICEFCLINSDNKIIGENLDPHELFNERLSDIDIFDELNFDNLISNLKDTGLPNEMLRSLGKIPLVHSVNELNIPNDFKNLFDISNLENFINSFLKFYKESMQDERYKDLRNFVQKGLQINRNQIYNHPNPYDILSKSMDKLGIGDHNLKLESNYQPEWFSKINNEYIILDMSGYQEDKINISKGRHETFANTTDDASHAAYSSACHFYILNDNKSYQKTKKNFEKLGVNTIVFKPNEFIDYYNTCLNIDDIFQPGLPIRFVQSANYDEEIVEEDGFYRYYYLPFFMFNFFDKITIHCRTNESIIFFLSRTTTPNDHITYFIEIKNLILQLNKYLGNDIDNLGEFNENEISNNEWKGRNWQIDKINIRLVLLDKRIQLYYDFPQ